MADTRDYTCELDLLEVEFEEDQSNQESSNWKTKVQPLIRQLYLKHWYYMPTPNVSALRNLSYDLSNAFDVCDFVACVWELTHTGMSGLRYNRHVYSDKKWTVYCDEVGSNTSEDLSDMSTWLAGASPTIGRVRSYWFVRMFTNCSTIAKGLFKALEMLKNTLPYKTIDYNGITLDLKTAEIRGYSLLQRDGCEYYNLFNRSEADALSNEAHRIGESHNHVVISIKEKGTDNKYILDLAGSQFGIFGEDPQRPHIVIEPEEEYMKHFKRIRYDTPGYPYEDKIAQFEKLVSTLLLERIQVKKRLGLGASATSSSRIISGKKTTTTTTIEVTAEATAKASQAERDLLALLDAEDWGAAKAVGKGKSCDKGASKESKTKK